MKYIDYYQSPIGLLQVVATDDALLEINFCEVPVDVRSNFLTERAILQLEEYFSLERQRFDLPIQMHGTLFQQEVWKKLMEIPYGTTVSYSEITKMLNKEKAVRAVAHAIGQNPLLILIPCHRVIGKNQALTGYKAGIDRKKYLLDLEYPQ